MKILEREFTREVDASLSVVLWNYLDPEHLTVVHDGYTAAQFLYETASMHVILTTFKVPIFSFLRSNGISTVVLSEHTETAATLLNFNLGLFGVPSVTTIRMEETAPDHCRITMSYRFILRGWHQLLVWPMGRMMATWNARVWDEDLPLKLRRQKVLRMGFKDFVGLPQRVADRHYDGPLPIKLPLARPADSPVDDLARRLRGEGGDGGKGGNGSTSPESA